MVAQPFVDRARAGRRLAESLARFMGRRDVLVLALPRGGIPIAAEITKALGVAMDAFTVRKIGAPGHPELAMGAVASGGILVVNDEVVGALNVTRAQFLEELRRQSAELRRRESAYRGDRPEPQIEGKAVIIVDDGAATGSTMRVALDAVRRRRPAELIVALPVAPEETCAELEFLADEVICLVRPKPFRAVGASYADFSEVSDDEARRLLDEATHRTSHV